MNQVKSIAVVMTCHNRRETTLKCLRSLYGQTLPDSVVLETYLVDDGCSDGTDGAVREHFPAVRVLQGDGNLYWCGGMRMAWAEAMKGDYNYYLWLNDDTILLENALQVLLKSSQQIHKQEGKEGIVVGSCRDAETGERTYGGSLCNGLPLEPIACPQPCELMNGNIALIPHGVSKVVGNLSTEFAHTSADNDYGLRAIKAGFTLWVAPGYQGLCAANDHALWADPKVPIGERWASLHDPKGQPPYEIYIYARRHKGFLWPLDLVKLYLRVLFPRLYDKLKERVKW